MSELTAMKTLIMVRDCGSLSQAAIEMNEPKSTLSRRLAILESQLDQRLTCQIGRSLALTRAGQCYAVYAEQILQLASEGQQALRTMKNSLSGELCFGLCPELSHGWSTETLNRFRLHYPEISLDIRIVEHPEQHLLPPLDLQISCCHCQSLKKNRRLGRWEQGVYGATAQQEIMSQSELEKQCWILSPDIEDEIPLYDQSGTQVMMICPKKRIKISSLHMRADAISLGHGVGLLPCWMAQCRRYKLEIMQRILPELQGEELFLQIQSDPKRWTPAVGTLQSWLINELPTRWRI